MIGKKQIAKEAREGERRMIAGLKYFPRQKYYLSMFK